MKTLKKFLSLILCTSLVLTLVLPNFALDNDDQSSDVSFSISSSDYEDEKQNVGEDENSKGIVEEEKVKDNESSTVNSSEPSEFFSEDISTPSDIDENNFSSDEEPEEDQSKVNEQDNYIEEIATRSETLQKSQNEREIDGGYANLSTIDQFNYVVNDSAKQVGDTIVLLKDVTLHDTVKFNNLNLDLNGFNIVGPNNNYALYIENNFTLTDSTVTDDAKSSISAVNYSFPTIYANGANINLSKVKVFAADGPCGGDAIYTINSDIIIDGAIIKGGNGIDSNSEKGGDGGNALVIYKSTKQNKINVNSGFLYGGNGGKGLGDQTPDEGAAILYNGIYQGNGKTGKGRPGKKGGGNGGMAVNILTKDFDINKLTYEDMTLYAGSAGGSINKSDENQSSSTLFGSIDDDVNKPYYSLFDLDGKSYLTPLKNQGSLGLCANFAQSAQAETYMMMEHPGYVKNVLGKVVETVCGTFLDRDKYIDLCELYFAMCQNNPPRDAFGNGGTSNATKESDRNRWTDLGTTTQTQLAMASSWRGFVSEYDGAYNYVGQAVPQSATNQHVNDTIVHAKNMRIYSASDYLDDDNNFDNDKWVSDLKRAIVKNHGVYIGGYYGTYQTPGYTYDTAPTTIDYQHVGTDFRVIYGEKRIDDYSGHGMFCIGWDDEFQMKKRDASTGWNWAPDPSREKGAFIIKNSWDGFALIPYDNEWNHWYGTNDFTQTPSESDDFMAAEYMPAFSIYENNYFHDSGVSGVSINTKVNVSNRTLSSNIKADLSIDYKKVLNVFKIRNDKEKALAASFYANRNDRQYEVALYRVPNDSNESAIYAAISNESNKLTSKTFTTFHGVNVIDFDTPVDLLKDTYVAVVITADEDNMGRTWVDGDGYEELDVGTTFYHTTEKKQKSFLAAPSLSIDKIYKDGVEVAADEFNTISNTYRSSLIDIYNCYRLSNANLRIKLWTNNYVTLESGTDGNIGGYDKTFYYPTLKASMSDLPTPTVTNPNKKFVAYNTKADGSGKTYDKNSIYSLDIADYLKLYAIYENKENPTEASTSATTTEEPSTSAVSQSTVAPTTKKKSSYIPYSGGGNNGGGGGGGKGIAANNLPNIVPAEIQTSPVAKLQARSNDISVNVINNDKITWQKDSSTNKWKLNVEDLNGSKQAQVGFYVISGNVSGIGSVANTYYIDESGNMMTGWLNTLDDKWYFFDDTKDSNEGKMAIGWKKIQNDWYYFNSNGTMLTNATTPDGYKVGASGKLE